MQWKQRLGLGILLAMGSINGVQARPSAAQVQAQMEASMNVAGELTLTPDGTVTAVKLTDEASLPPVVRDRVKQSIASWRFDPVKDDGSALPAQLPMNLLLVAKPGDNNTYAVSIRSAHFGSEEQGAASVAAKDMPPPAYPEHAFREGATGVVYLLLKIGRDGKVEDLVAEQVNLTTLAPESKRPRWRKAFADAAIAKAQRWTFVPPTQGAEADAPYWVMRVPVTFDIETWPRNLTAAKQAKTWQSYLPGPRQPAPWHEQRGASASTDSPDALPGSGLFSARGVGVRLVTPLQGS
ncbi:energy transducer TonB [Xanthomonas hortorum]|uniref:energy transducer TonB n=1 Tax=Xanthomonas hortorum TaxID=56454 RepID=UPI001F3B92FD|nr:energy transducer TonB [Xanthomonas hortorum]MCE4361687.1 energy transducer TonB [Xanthomonas hortorum]